MYIGSECYRGGASRYLVHLWVARGPLSCPCYRPPHRPRRLGRQCMHFCKAKPLCGNTSRTDGSLERNEMSLKSLNSNVTAASPPFCVSQTVRHDQSLPSASSAGEQGLFPGVKPALCHPSPGCPCLSGLRARKAPKCADVEPHGDATLPRLGFTWVSRLWAEPKRCQIYRKSLILRCGQVPFCTSVVQPSSSSSQLRVFFFSATGASVERTLFCVRVAMISWRDSVSR